ncbi:MAG: Si-specific NAD(P)(+) transhydrogenase [bacterium]|nr:Si-specific NAD(P)(+) transhydrogenase [bacterium]MCP5067360.1 Si-specific NAD(P)(+) transhydrogenase [bacterium]
MTKRTKVDLLVLGGGPGGQKAAIAAAKAGRRVILVESGRDVGGACVHKGTIPSKALRQLAVEACGDDDTLGDAGEGERAIPLAEMKTRVDAVRAGHSRFMRAQLERNGIGIERGRGRFETDHVVSVTTPRGAVTEFEAEHIIIATGSRPREPDGFSINHEHVLDSDSILSLSYVPDSLVVLGGGVIACEYASIFLTLGSQVTIVDRAPRPLAFLDPDLSAGYVEAFERRGGRYVPEAQATGIEWDGFSKNMVALADGSFFEASKVLVALGRVGCLPELALERAGLEASSRGLLEVDQDLRTRVPHIYAVGDVIGPPALATTAMEQGRRAATHAVGGSIAEGVSALPVGIYTIPDMATVGLSESEARDQGFEVAVGRARFDELARALINHRTEGWLKLVSDRTNGRILGVQILGENATDLIHVGQVAIHAGWSADDFVENAFNFPTFTEAYRVASLAVLEELTPTG